MRLYCETFFATVRLCKEQDKTCRFKVWRHNIFVQLNQWGKDEHKRYFKNFLGTSKLVRKVKFGV